MSHIYLTGSASLQPDSLFFNFSVYLSALILVICMRSDSTDNILMKAEDDFFKIGGNSIKGIKVV